MSALFTRPPVKLYPSTPLLIGFSKRLHSLVDSLYHSASMNRVVHGRIKQNTFLMCALSSLVLRLFDLTSVEIRSLRMSKVIFCLDLSYPCSA